MTLQMTGKPLYIIKILGRAAVYRREQWWISTEEREFYKRLAINERYTNRELEII